MHGNAGYFMHKGNAVERDTLRREPLAYRTRGYAEPVGEVFLLPVMGAQKGCEFFHIQRSVAALKYGRNSRTTFVQAREGTGVGTLTTASFDPT